MKKFLTLIVQVCFICVQIFSPVFAGEKLPDLPDLPPEFDAVIPPEGVDVFSPSTTPAEVAPKNPVQQTVSTPASTKQTNENYSAKPVQTAPVNQQTNVKTQPVKSSLTPVKTTLQTKNKIITPQKTYTSKTTATNTYVVPKGKKFNVRLQQSISSNSPVGTRISFVSRYPETSPYITIPAGTVFKGRITDSHPPQLTGNGGLIVINVDQMVYNGKTYEIDAKISVANDKHIFFNNIKGKRMYLRSIPKSIKPGSRFFKKMWRKTTNLARNDNGVEIILTPFTFLTGAVVYAVNFVSSPVLALFYKGQSITIPSGALFKIQLRDDAIIRK